MSKDPFEIRNSQKWTCIYYGWLPSDKGTYARSSRKVLIFDHTDKEYQACFDLVRVVKDHLINKYGTKSFNIGINCGTDAGQTIFHAHIHIIPRYKNDVTNPRGGVRNVIPNKADY